MAENMSELEFNNPYELPPGLPVPVDNGACDHLLGVNVPSVVLSSTGKKCECCGSIGGKSCLLLLSRGR